MSNITPLTGEQIAQFHEQGYLVVERNIPRQVIRDAQRAGERIVEKCLQMGYPQARSDVRLADTAIEKIEHIFSPKLFEPLLFDMVVQSEILHYARQLLGTSDIYLAFNRLHTTRGYSAWSNWHRDARADGTHHFLKVTLPLFSEAGFFVIPGSHKAGDQHLVGSAVDTRIRTNQPEQVRVPVRAGDLLFFHSAIWHRGTCAGRRKYRRAHIHLNFINMASAETTGQTNQDYLFRDETWNRLPDEWKQVIRRDVPRIYPETYQHAPGGLARKVRQLFARSYYFATSIFPGNEALTDNPPQWLVPYVRVPREYRHYFDPE